MCSWSVPKDEEEVSAVLAVTIPRLLSSFISLIRSSIGRRRRLLQGSLSTARPVSSSSTSSTSTDEGDVDRDRDEDEDGRRDGAKEEDVEEGEALERLKIASWLLDDGKEEEDGEEEEEEEEGEEEGEEDG